MTNLQQAWQEALVAEVKPLLFENKTYGSFELIPGTTQIFSLSPAEDYEVDEFTIAGWRLVYDLENALFAEYFSALEKLKHFALDEKSGSLLIRIPAEEDLTELFKN